MGKSRQFPRPGGYHYYWRAQYSAMCFNSVYTPRKMGSPAINKTRVVERAHICNSQGFFRGFSELQEVA
jgi:hypothetical protein